MAHFEEDYGSYNPVSDRFYGEPKRVSDPGDRVGYTVERISQERIKSEINNLINGLKQPNDNYTINRINNLIALSSPEYRRKYEDQLNGTLRNLREAEKGSAYEEDIRKQEEHRKAYQTVKANYKKHNIFWRMLHKRPSTTMSNEELNSTYKTRR